MALIEVDREWTAATQPAARSRRLRGYLVALGLLVTLLLGGATAPARPPEPVASIPDSGRDTFEIVRSTLYLAEPDRTDQTRLTAYALPAGRVTGNG